METWRRDVLENALPAFLSGLFSPNMEDIGEEHGQRFHQDTKIMEIRYQRKWDFAMMDDNILGLLRSTDLTYKRKTRSAVHF